MLEAKIRAMTDTHQAATARVARVNCCNDFVALLLFGVHCIILISTVYLHLVLHICFIQAKADLQRSNDARDSLEQAVEEMKRELIATSAASTERSALQDEVPCMRCSRC